MRLYGLVGHDQDVWHSPWDRVIQGAPLWGRAYLLPAPSPVEAIALGVERDAMVAPTKDDVATFRYRVGQLVAREGDAYRGPKLDRLVEMVTEMVRDEQVAYGAASRRMRRVAVRFRELARLTLAGEFRCALWNGALETETTLHLSEDAAVVLASQEPLWAREALDAPVGSCRERELQRELHLLRAENEHLLGSGGVPGRSRSNAACAAQLLLDCARVAGTVESQLARDYGEWPTPDAAVDYLRALRR